MDLGLLLLTGVKSLKARVNKDARIPIGVYLSVTERCPNKCIYCNFRDMSSKNGEEMSTGEVLRIIDELHRLGMRKLHLTGGEPLLRDDIGEIIGHAKSKGIFVGISCSGIFVPEKIEELINADIVMLSLDGPQEIHDSLRGEGSFKRVMAAMDRLSEYNIKFWTITVLNKMNLDSIDYVLDMAQEKKCYANFVVTQYHMESHESNLPDAESIRQIIPPPDELRKSIRYIIEKKKEGSRVGSTFSYLDFILRWDDYNILFVPKRIKGCRCWAGKIYFHIDSRGFIHACGLGYGIIDGVDTKAIGVEEALKRVQRMPGCNSCLAACNIENNLIFSLKPDSIVNWLQKL